MLTAAEQQRFARHLLLAEIGRLGQEALLSTRARVPRDADERACAVAVDYLARAGVAVAGTVVGDDARGRAVELDMPSAASIARMAGGQNLEEAAAAVAGAFAAVELIKRGVGAGRPGSLGEDFTIGPRP